MNRFYTDLSKFWMRTLRRMLIEMLLLAFVIFIAYFQSILQLPAWGKLLLVGATAGYFIVGILMLPSAVRAAQEFCIELDLDSLVVHTHKSSRRIPYTDICIDMVTMQNRTVRRFVIRSGNIGKIAFETLQNLDALYHRLLSVGVAFCAEQGGKEIQE